MPAVTGLMNRFSRTVRLRARLSSPRLLETKPILERMASRGAASRSASPPSVTLPASIARSPKIARPTTSWPAPRRPTSPKISPAATLKETGPTSPRDETLDRQHGAGGRSPAA